MGNVTGSPTDKISARIEALVSAVKLIASLPRQDAVKAYPDEDMLVNGVRHFLGYSQNRKRWEDHRDEILDMIEDGMSQKKIAEKFGVCQGSVSEALKRLGIKTSRTDMDWTEREKKWLEYYRKKGMTAYEISHLIGRSVASIHVKARAMKLPKLTDKQISEIRHRTSFRKKKEAEKGI